MDARARTTSRSRQKKLGVFSLNLATLTLETRHTGRSIQVSYNEHLERIENNNQRDRFLGEVLGDPNDYIV